MIKIEDLLISLFLGVALFAHGCMGEESIIYDCDGEDDDDDDDDDDQDTYPELDEDVELDKEDYEGFEDADEDMAPGEIISIVDDSHEGYLSARCFECHGAHKGDEPEYKHDRAMQAWTWSCARGFPNSSCHGHFEGDNVNGSTLYNHDGLDSFKNCTQSMCHDTFNAELKDRENHGFHNAPDAYCNACHDFFWEDDPWPEDNFKLKRK